ncbi:hypothetical protein ACFW17_07205 [Streptomyces sp. NPDC058961]|uniref:hypothetical protein n=1 Tax=Streptomyces sp. NPDC058961 TaxID=3346680 RepID=UPI0036C6D456
MSPPRWLPSRRQPPQPPPGDPPSSPPEPATLILLDIIEDVMDDDVPLTEVLREARFHAVDMLGIPAEYSAVVEASAAWQIVQEAGDTIDSPFGRKIAQGLARIDQGLARIEQSPVEEQQRLVRAAARRYAITAPPRPVSPPPSRAPGHSR